MSTPDLVCSIYSVEANPANTDFYFPSRSVVNLGMWNDNWELLEFFAANWAVSRIASGLDADETSFKKELLRITPEILNRLDKAIDGGEFGKESAKQARELSNNARSALSPTHDVYFDSWW